MSVLIVFGVLHIIVGGVWAVDTCTTSGVFCADTCTDVKICLGAELVITKPCAMLTNNQLNYCENDQCVKASTKSGCGPNYKCTSDGAFPDTTDCAKYIYCTGSTFSVETCDKTGFYFDAKAAACVKSGSAVNTCKTFNCGTVKDNFITYNNPKPSRFYAYCRTEANGLVSKIVYQCKENEVFDLKTVGCAFVCPREGNFPVPDDTTKYRNCYKTSTTGLKYDVKTCRTGTVFDAAAKMCVTNS